MTETNTTDEAAIKLMEAVVNRWEEMGQPLEPLAGVVLSVAIDLHVRALGDRAAANYLRDLADSLHADSGAYDA